LSIHILHFKESFIANLSQLEIQHSSRYFLASKSFDSSILALAGYNVYMYELGCIIARSCLDISGRFRNDYALILHDWKI